MSDKNTDLMHNFPTYGEAAYSGLIKLKLVHADGFSLILPELIVIEIDGWKWFQPKFFSPSLISILDEGNAYCQFNVDTDTDARLFIGLTKDQLLRQYVDGSQVYKCQVSGPAALDGFASGKCNVDENSDIKLQLFHHTLPETISKIRDCGYFLGSPWNVQGNKKLVNVAYAYFTSLPAIQSDDDLRRIAMASDGKIHLLPTNATSNRDIVTVDVYRQSTWDRRSSMTVFVATDLIGPQHVWRHAPQGLPVYYEVCHPSISRVGLQPGQVLRISGDQIDPAGDELKRFSYVVLGDADDPNGLVAPYDEEHTRSLFHIENCGDQTFFDFWVTHANTDQFSGRSVELQHFEKP
jgi:hypothetical protein